MGTRTPHVVLAWELGGSFGHITRCWRLAQSLRNEGVQASLVLKDVRLPVPLKWNDPVHLAQTPQTSPRLKVSAPRNHAELLLVCGFSNPNDLAGRLKAWQGLWSATPPDVVVCDHAPTALLAAKLAGAPSMSIGNGFAVPPNQHPWPAYRPWTTVPPSDLQTAEDQLDHCVDQAWRHLGRPGMAPKMRELYQQPAILDTLPELDPYPQRATNCTYVGPITDLPSGMRSTWSGGEHIKVLGYLHPQTPGLAALLEALDGLHFEAHLVIPGHPSAGTTTRRQGPGLNIYAEPLCLPPLLPEAALAISNGNNGFSTQCLLAGTPLLMYPRHTEQGLTCLRIEQLGAGLIAPPTPSTDDTRRLLNHMIDDSSLTTNARALAQRHASLGGERAVKQAVQLILRAIA